LASTILCLYVLWSGLRVCKLAHSEPDSRALNPAVPSCISEPVSKLADREGCDVWRKNTLRCMTGLAVALVCVAACCRPSSGGHTVIDVSERGPGVNQGSHQF